MVIIVTIKCEESMTKISKIVYGDKIPNREAECVKIIGKISINDGRRSQC